MTLSIQTMIQRLHKQWIRDDNPEWREIAELRAAVAESFAAGNGLAFKTFERIAKWKLRKQSGRTQRHRQKTTSELVALLSICCWQASHGERDVKARIRLHILTGLPGVGIGLASAILSLTWPDEYGIVDFRVWKVHYGVGKKNFTETDWLRYMGDVWKLSAQTGYPPQTIDYLLWKAYEET
jgi:hypothetical protein